MGPAQYGFTEDQTLQPGWQIETGATFVVFAVSAMPVEGAIGGVTRYVVEQTRSRA